MDFYLLTDFALVSSLRVSSSSAQEAVKQALIKSFSAFGVSATHWTHQVTGKCHFNSCIVSLLLNFLRSLGLSSD